MWMWGGWGRTGVSVEGCGVSRSSPWHPSTLHIQTPLVSHPATCKLNDEKQLFSQFFFFLPPVKSLSSPLMGGGGEFEITLAVKDGDRQDKQETPDSRDF